MTKLWPYTILQAVPHVRSSNLVLISGPPSLNPSLVPIPVLQSGVHFRSPIKPPYLVSAPGGPIFGLRIQSSGLVLFLYHRCDRTKKHYIQVSGNVSGHKILRSNSAI